MIHRTDTSITLTQDADRTASALFAVLVDPHRHVELDGSGMLRAAEDTTIIDHVDQVFSMAMHYPSLGDYVTDNRITELEPDRRIGWATARRGQPAAGVRWGWQFGPLDEEHTRIVHTYDWSRVTDPAVLARVSFPRVSPEQLQASVGRLIELAAS